MGNFLSDSKPYDSDESKGNLNIKKTAMSFWTALKLSFGNIRTKKGRTILNSFCFIDWYYWYCFDFIFI